MRYHHRAHQGDGVPLHDYACSRTFRDFFDAPYGPVYRDPEDSIDDRIRRAVRDELAARDAAADNQRRHDRVLFGPATTQEEPPEMPPVDELSRTPAQTPQAPKAEPPNYRGVSLD